MFFCVNVQRKSKANSANRAMKTSHHKSGSKPIAHRLAEAKAAGSQAPCVDVYKFAYPDHFEEIVSVFVYFALNCFLSFIKYVICLI